MASSRQPSTVSKAQLLISLLQIAAEMHRAGEYTVACALCREVLALDPWHADALCLLAKLRRQAGRLDEACQLLQRAVSAPVAEAAAARQLRWVEHLLHCQKNASQANQVPVRDLLQQAAPSDAPAIARA